MKKTQKQISVRVWFFMLIKLFIKNNTGVLAAEIDSTLRNIYNYTDYIWINNFK